MPPIPVPSTTASRAGSTSSTRERPFLRSTSVAVRPASASASCAPASANWVAGSRMSRSLAGMPCASGSKPVTGAPIREPIVARIGSGQSSRRPPERPATEPSQNADRPMPIEVTGPSPVTTTREGITQARGGSRLSAALRAPADHDADVSAVAASVDTEEPVAGHQGCARGDPEIEVVPDAVEDAASHPQPVGVVAAPLLPRGYPALDVRLDQGQPRATVGIPALTERPD